MDLVSGSVEHVVSSCCFFWRSSAQFRLVHNTRFAPCHLQIYLSCLDALLHADDASELPAFAAARANLRCAMVDLDFAALSAMPSQLTGHWADTFSALTSRDPAFAQAFTRSLEGSGPLPHALAALKEAIASLQAAGFQAPTWNAVLSAVPSAAPEATPPILYAGGSA